MLEKQLERGAFDAAEKSALKHQCLSVAYADEIAQILKDTCRDLRAVLDQWSRRCPVGWNAPEPTLRTGPTVNPGSCSRPESRWNPTTPTSQQPPPGSPRDSKRAAAGTSGCTTG